MPKYNPDAPGRHICLADKVRFLQQPASYGPEVLRVDVKETHMSWVFMTENHVYKLKKPVRLDFLDYGTVDQRRHNCVLELQLNRRLADWVYIGVVGLGMDDDGQLVLGDRGLIVEDRDQVVDWLVKMHRLPLDRMLDQCIETASVTVADIERVGELLATFYREVAAPVDMTPENYLDTFADDIDATISELGRDEFSLPRPLIVKLGQAQRRYLATHYAELERRVEEDCIVEGHGDLRPEHVCLLQPPVIIDCLEFSRRFRVLDPFDELAYLALECERLGAGWIGEQLLSGFSNVIACPPRDHLIRFYKGFRACLRAKIAAWHILDCEPDEHRKWLTKANTYLRLAEAYLG